MTIGEFTSCSPRIILTGSTERISGKNVNNCFPSGFSQVSSALSVSTSSPGVIEMQISIRSQLIAGTAAVVGASAIAMTPVTPANLAMPDLQLPSAAQVSLAAFDSPLSQLLGTFNSFNQWLASAGDDPADYQALGG